MQQLNFLLEAGYLYSTETSWSFQTGNNDPIVLCNRISSAIERISLPNSTYRKQLEAADLMPQPYKFIDTYSVAQGLRDDLVAGWHESMVELVHADTHNDYLEMAEELLDKGCKDPSAIITGTSLEVHIRALCVKHGVDIESPSGTPKKADTMNADLKKVGAYEALQ